MSMEESNERLHYVNLMEGDREGGVGGILI